MKKNVLTIALTAISSLCATSAIASQNSYDARSFGMGGIGVSTSNYLTAAFHNPALVARYDEDDDFGILLPYVGASVQDPDSMIDQLDDFSDLYDNSVNDPNLQNAEKMTAALKKLQGSQGKVQAGVGVAVAVPNQYLSFSLFGKAYADAFVLADVSSEDLSADNINNAILSDGDYDFKSRGLTIGVSVLEVGVALGKDFNVGSNGSKFYAGITPKMQQVNTINYSVDINNYDFDDWNDDKYQNEDTNFNVDVGFAYALSEGFVFGVTGSNLISQDYSTTVDGGVQGTYEINPVYTVSASYGNSWVTVGVDVDLNEAERYKEVSGLLSGNVDTNDDNVQIAAIGAEFNAFDWAQLRLGYSHDIAGTYDDTLTVGLGLSPFDVLHIDLAASYAGDDELGASIQTSLTF